MLSSPLVYAHFLIHPVIFSWCRYCKLYLNNNDDNKINYVPDLVVSYIFLLRIIKVKAIKYCAIWYEVCMRFHGKHNFMVVYINRPPLHLCNFLSPIWMSNIIIWLVLPKFLLQDHICYVYRLWVIFIVIHMCPNYSRGK